MSVLAIIALGMAMAFSLPAGASSAQAQLRAKALTLSDMPSGWSVDNSSSGGLSNATGCLSKLQSQSKPSKGIVQAKADYTDGNAPALEETLLAGSAAAKHYAALIKVLNSCKTVSFNASGTEVTGSAGAMSFPTVGTASSAYAFTFSAKGITLGLDVIVFRVGSIAGDLAYFDLGSPDADTVQAFATAAVDKIQGKPVTVPTDAF
jgi:hypothetical protein